MATQQTRDKISRAHKGKKHSEATKEKMRLAARGPHAFSHRRRMAQETKNKISASMQGKHHTEATKEKIRERLLAYEELRKAGLLPRFHHSEETKEKLRALAQGRKPSAKCLAASVAARKEKAFRKKMKHAKEIGFYN